MKLDFFLDYRTILANHAASDSFGATSSGLSAPAVGSLSGRMRR